MLFSEIFSSVILNLASPLALAIFYYDFILKPFHKKYDTDIRYVIIPISIRKHLLLRFTYIGLFLSMIVIYFYTVNITGIPFSEKDYKGFYMFMEFLLPLLFYTVLFAIPAQFLVLVQKGWSLGTKITNILVVEAVFLSVYTIIVFLSYCIITISPILYSNTGSFIPFIVLAGGVLLRHIFMKSSMDALELEEL